MYVIYVYIYSYKLFFNFIFTLQRFYIDCKFNIHKYYMCFFCIIFFMHVSSLIITNNTISEDKNLCIKQIVIKKNGYRIITIILMNFI